VPSRSSSPFRKAAGRLSLRLAGDDPAPDQIVAARCLQRHDISRLPQVKGDKPKRGKFSACPIGYLHVEMAELRVRRAARERKDGNFARLPPPTDRGCPYKIHTVLTDSGIQFRTPGGGAPPSPSIREAWPMVNPSGRQGRYNHQTPKPEPPWTNGQVELMNRTIKEATVRRFYYESHDYLREHLANLVAAYNYAKRLKTCLAKRVPQHAVSTHVDPREPVKRQAAR